MINKMLYPKTTRVGKNNSDIVITEKLDGSNLGFFAINNELYIAMRNNIIAWNDVKEGTKDRELITNYKGLLPFLETNADWLAHNIYDKSVVFGEWMGMGKLKYNNSVPRFNIFAKARIVDANYNIGSLNWDLNLLKYVFNDKVIPEDILSIVPLVGIFEHNLTIAELDELYDDYSKRKNRNVEGFVIRRGMSIEKYVRMKNGKLEAHHA